MKSSPMKRLIPVLIYAMFFSCGDSATVKKESNEKQLQTASGKDSLVADSGFHDDSLWNHFPLIDTSNNEPRAPEIGKIGAQPGMMFSDPLYPYLVLDRFFPGNFRNEVSEFSDEKLRMMWWRCENCPREEVIYEYFNESVGWFPDSAWNTTMVEDLVKLQGEKEEYRLMVLNHFTDMYPERVGRFSGANVGLALFRKKANEWELRNFDAFIGQFGSFSSPFIPGIRRVGKEQWLLDCSYSNGGGGGAYTTVSTLFIPYKGGFLRVLEDSCWSLGNTEMGEWNTQIVILDSLMDGTSDLELLTEGIFFSDGDPALSEEETWALSLMPVELQKQMELYHKKGKHIRFSMKRRFHFNGKKYELVSINLDHSPGQKTE